MADKRGVWHRAVFNLTVFQINPWHISFLKIPNESVRFFTSHARTHTRFSTNPWERSYGIPLSLACKWLGLPWPSLRRRQIGDVHLATSLSGLGQAASKAELCRGHAHRPPVLHSGKESNIAMTLKVSLWAVSPEIVCGPLLIIQNVFSLTPMARKRWNLFYAEDGLNQGQEELVIEGWEKLSFTWKYC
jgi:hypothetical protein